MGKAAIVGSVVVIIAVIAAVLVVWFRRQRAKETAAARGWAIKGDLNKTQERQIVGKLNEAAALLRDLATPPIDLGYSSTLLSPEDRARVETWLRSHNTTMKGIEHR